MYRRFAAYEFAFDAAEGILKIVIRGFLREEDFPGYREAYARNVTAARRRTGALRLLVDTCESAVLSPTVGQDIRAMAEKFVNRREDRVAVVVCSSLKKLQVERLFGGGNHRIFPSRGAARAWLLGADCEAEPAAAD